MEEINIPEEGIRSTISEGEITDVEQEVKQQSSGFEIDPTDMIVASELLKPKFEEY
ncbi:MAG: hypothetical protein IJS02_05035 [Bacteroidales bacterium]|nr:hypothetical protein [Bacteroidales bacterium]